VSEAGGEENVGGRQVGGQVLAGAKPRIYSIGVLALQTLAFGSVADYELGALPRDLQESSDIIFDGDASDVRRDRPRQLQEILVARSEQLGIDAAPPAYEVAEPARGQ